MPKLNVEAPPEYDPVVEYVATQVVDGVGMSIGDGVGRASARVLADGSTVRSDRDLIHSSSDMVKGLSLPDD